MNKTCKDGLEGELVNVADMLELGIYSWEEYNQGNKSMKGMLDKAVRLIKGYDFTAVLKVSSPLFSSILFMLDKASATNSGIEHLYHID